MGIDLGKNSFKGSSYRRRRDCGRIAAIDHAGKPGSSSEDTTRRRRLSLPECFSPEAPFEYSPGVTPGFPGRAPGSRATRRSMIPSDGREGETVIQLGELVMILDLHRQGLSVTAIARRVGIDRRSPGRHQPVPRRDQRQSQALHLDRRSRRHHRKSAARETGVRVNPLVGSGKRPSARAARNP